MTYLVVLTQIMTVLHGQTGRQTNRQTEPLSYTILAFMRRAIKC